MIYPIRNKCTDKKLKVFRATLAGICTPLVIFHLKDCSHYFLEKTTQAFPPDSTYKML